MKKDLLDEVGMFLLKQGYTIKVLAGAFDIIARKEQIMLIKVLVDANAVAKEHAEQMKHIASYIDGVPLIIAEKAGAQLADNIAYMRFGIFTFNFQTFKSCVARKLPIIKSTQAGFTAAVSGKMLKQVREQRGYSLNTLARRLGVSKRMIQRYESDDSELTLIKAQRLYDLLGPGVFKQVKVFASCFHPVPEKTKLDVSKKYKDLGFEATETKKVHFDVIAKKDKEIILTEVSDKASPHLVPIARLFEVDKLVIFKKKKPKDIPSMTKKEFLEFEKARELVKFLKEFE